MKKRNWREARLHSMEIQYCTIYDLFKGHDDDRRVFCNTYDQIERALKSLPEEPDSYVKVAMWRKMCEDKALLDRIYSKFVDAEDNNDLDANDWRPGDAPWNAPGMSPSDFI